MGRKAMRVCLGSNRKESNHLRRRCRECSAAYNRKYRKTKQGKTADSEWNRRVKNTNMAKAKARVFVEVRAGRMPMASQFKCKCGSQAAVYDHRDYLKPLLVQAVCRPCNRRLGRGRNSGI